MTMNDVIKIAVLPGDGIGEEVTEAALPIVKALNLPMEIHRGDIGWACWQEQGDPLPEKTWQLIRHCDATLIGAITSKPVREALRELSPKLQKNHLEYVSPLIQLRQKLDLFANVRPCFNLVDREQPFHFCIIRENTEGLYAGFDFHPPPEPISQLIRQQKRWQHTSSQDLSVSLRLQSRQGLQRLFEFAFQYAKDNQFARVTFADKPNVLRQSGAFARDIFEAVAARYSAIHADIANIDAAALWLVRRPEEFGVIVAENMFGDILSDVGAAVMGGLGFAPSANMGHQGCYFEPVHGSGPRITSHRANPSAMFLTIGLLLKHFGYNSEAERITRAIAAVIKDGRYLTYDLGGKSTTEEMAQVIIEQVIHPDLPTPVFLKQRSDAKRLTLDLQLQQLKQYSTAEIADALDACGVDGALLHIKPLTSGIKLAGPAYTVQYSPYQRIGQAFKQAANYIDNVPANAVIVIDNQGRIDCTVWGDILTQAALVKGIAGTVVNGAVRDVAKILNSNYPLFSVERFMRSGKNRVQKSGEQCPVSINGVTIQPGDILFGDDNGVLVIPADLLAEVLAKAQAICETENKIIDAVKKGQRLDQAREDYRYDQPWLNSSDKG
ncbi:DlpA protein (isocitrate and isopropylmalate dehydrogenase family protein) [Legionella rubrilucens]|uniref:DlpA protein (Isocitrate and isopropylmalate dehydrogenase family protein) n=1 Tax=Legionella rubrilucens TaxID=458 RepID=A0A0W0XLX8_9GAMM|nr:DlpA protein (isocitrate and isopropylmalate dehydrogenase family protein) [Legionella rubrilucens]